VPAPPTRQRSAFDALDGSKVLAYASFGLGEPAFTQVFLDPINGLSPVALVVLTPGALERLEARITAQRRSRGSRANPFG
jgi:hypothetical protein